VRDRLLARRLRRSDNRVLAAVGDALRASISPDERSWIDRIEAERARLVSSSQVVRTPLRDYSLDPAHEHVFEDRLGDLVVRGSKPRDAATFLFSLLRRVRPRRVLELGTSLGISAAYQGAALRLNEVGSMITVDASAERMAVAREVLARLELDRVVETRLGRFDDVLPELLASEPVGYAFVDGNHTEEATLSYLEQIHTALEPPGVVVFDDITWSDGMKRAWSRLRDDSRLAGHAEVHGMGVCVYRLSRYGCL
jgi:predicted O-methyltransferase YrrM